MRWSDWLPPILVVTNRMMTANVRPVPAQKLENQRLRTVSISTDGVFPSEASIAGGDDSSSSSAVSDTLSESCTDRAQL